MQFVVVIKKLFIELSKLFCTNRIITRLITILMLCILLLSLLYKLVLLLYTSHSLSIARSHSTGHVFTIHHIYRIYPQMHITRHQLSIKTNKTELS